MIGPKASPQVRWPGDRRQIHLVDDNGKPFTDANLKGKWQLVFSATPIAPMCAQPHSMIVVGDRQLGSRKARSDRLHQRRSRSRHPPAVLKSYVESFRRADRRGDRNARRGRSGGEGLQVITPSIRPRMAAMNGSQRPDLRHGPEGRFTATSPPTTPGHDGRSVRKAGG